MNVRSEKARCSELRHSMIGYPELKFNRRFGSGFRLQIPREPPSGARPSRNADNSPGVWTREAAMFFLPRLAPLITLALVGATIVALVLDASIILVASGAAFGVLLMAVLFNLYEPPKR